MSCGNGFLDGWSPSAGRLVCLFFARVFPLSCGYFWTVSDCLPSFGQHPYVAMVGEMENSQFGNFVTPSLQGEVDFLHRFSDLVLVLPSRVWHYTICFQLDSMLSAAFVAFPGFWFPGCGNIFENKPKAGLGCGFSKGKGSSKFLRDKIGTFPPSQVRDAGDPGGRFRCRHFCCLQRLRPRLRGSCMGLCVCVSLRNGCWQLRLCTSAH